MDTPVMTRDDLKQVVKEALAETLREHRDLLAEVVQEVLEDAALGEAIREGEQTEPMSREEVFRILRGETCE